MEPTTLNHPSFTTLDVPPVGPASVPLTPPNGAIAFDVGAIGASSKAQAPRLAHSPVRCASVTECYLKVWRFQQISNTNNTCGPAAMAMLLHYYGIGWGDIPCDAQGHPSSDPFVTRVGEWSQTPNVAGGLLGTSGDRIQDSLKRVSKLHAAWYTDQHPNAILDTIKAEVANRRPVIVLIDMGDWWLDWQVVYGYNAQNIYCHSPIPGHNAVYSTMDFMGKLNNAVPWHNRSFITVWPQ